MFQVGMRRGLLSSTLVVGSAVFFFGLSLPAVAQQDAKPTGTDQAAPATAPAPTNSSQTGQAVDPLKRPISEKQKKENAKALKQELSKTYKKWLDEDVVYIISDEE